MMPDDSSSLLNGAVAGDAEIAETRHVVLGHLGELAGGDAVLPDLAEVRLTADIFLEQHVTAPVDGHVVVHVAGFGAVEQRNNIAAELRSSDIREAQTIQTAAAHLSCRRCP